MSSAPTTPAPEDAVPSFADYRATGDRRLRNRLIEHHRGLAAQLARRFRGRGQNADDLEQVAMLGLLKAVERFEPERGLAFTTFATPTILGELKRHFRDATWSMRVPRRIQEHVLAVSNAIGPLGQELGRPPTVAEVAKATGFSEESVLEAMEANRAYSAQSLDAPTGDRDDGDADLASRLGEPDPGHADVEHRLLIESLLGELPEGERMMVRLRVWDGWTPSQIADSIGMREMHVSRILTRTLDRLRVQVESEAGVETDPPAPT
jgi:RNA polymerase sigma-B factor